MFRAADSGMERLEGKLFSERELSFSEICKIQSFCNKNTDICSIKVQEKLNLEKILLAYKRDYWGF